MKRREFVAGLGGAVVVWPHLALAQQSALPVIGFLHSTAPDALLDRLRAFRQGLKVSGYVEGENVAIVYRFPEHQNDQLPELAAELVRRKVAVIAAIGSAPLVAKAATTTIPIVFIAAEDPVALGLVESLSRPGGNLTGINLVSAELVAKRLELLRELVPGVVRVAVFINPTSPYAETTMRDAQAAGNSMGLQIQIVNASTGREIDTAFADLARGRPDALFVGNDPFFTSRRVQLAMLSARHVLPMVAGTREIAEVGALMSYGSNIADAWREVGVYTGRILKGAKPSDMPVVQANKFELVVNIQTAGMLGLTVPSALLARADEVIE